MNEGIQRLIRLSFLALFVVTIAACAKPKAELSVSKTKIRRGDAVTVNWKTENAREVLLNGQQIARVGSQLFQPDQSVTYELIGKRGSKEAKDSKTVTVEVFAAPVITFTVDRNAIDKGQTARLRWASQNSDKVEIAGLGSFGPSGEREVAPFDSITYIATAKGPGGEAAASARITVITGRTSNEFANNKNAEDILRRFQGGMRSIFFEFDKAELNPLAMNTLRGNAKFLLQAENRSIVFRVEGNCDPRGSEEYNLALGDRRANVAKTFLISHGIDPTRIDPVSNGKRKSAGVTEGSSDDPRSWAHDRRDDSIYLRGGELLRK